MPSTTFGSSPSRAATMWMGIPSLSISVAAVCRRTWSVPVGVPGSIPLAEGTLRSASGGAEGRLGDLQIRSHRRYRRPQQIPAPRFARRGARAACMDGFGVEGDRPP